MNTIEQLFEQSLIFDLETTSLDFRVAEVIQMATVERLVSAKSSNANGSPVWAVQYDSFFCPSEPISPEISAITGITNRMVEGYPSFMSQFDLIQETLLSKPYIIAHNSFYDEKIITKHGLATQNMLCTMRMAKKIYNDDVKVTAYNLPYLRYALDLPIDDSFVAHRADADAYMTAILFEHLVNKAVELWYIDPAKGPLGDQLLKWLDQPIIMHKMPFGKHKGKNMQDVPLDYWQWALETMDSLQEDKPEYDRDFSASVVYAVEQIFEKKG
jgi:exodeoxyribonuclease X